MPDLIQPTVRDQALQQATPAPATPDTRPGASDGLSPGIVQALSAARQGGLQQLFGAEWEAAGTRLDAAFRSEGPAAYERLTQSPESFGAVTGDPRHAATVAGGLYAQEQVLAEAQGEMSRSPEATPDGPSLAQTPQPSAWVGTDGKAVSMSRGEDGRIELGPNASPELARLAGYVSASGSEIAAALFVEASRGVTRLNFALGDSAVRPGLHGLHEPHDATGPTPWVSGDRDGTTGQFARPPDTVLDAAGIPAYREATVTLFEDTFTPEAVQRISNTYGSGGPLSRENAMVAVLAHELFHDMDDASLRAIMSRIGGTADPYAVEGEAYRAERLVLAQIQGAR